MFKRSGILLFGVFSYLMFFGVFNYMIGFIGNIFVPVSIDSEATSPFWYALLINVILLCAFGLQHSIMARQGFKKVWTKVIPQEMERSMFVLISSVTLMLVMLFWQPMGGQIWHTDNSIAQIILYGFYTIGVVFVFASSFMINHFDLFGLRQTWLAALNKPYTNLVFKTPMLYKLSRHPLYLGLLMMFWFTPTMTASHLVLALVWTTYVFIAIRLEENDLVNHFGDTYTEYQNKVPMIIPGVGKRNSDLDKQSVNAA